MKLILLIIGLITISNVCFGDEVSPEKVVKNRIAHLNNGNIDRFLSMYYPDVEVYVYPNRLLGKGINRLKKIFSPMIKKGKTKVELLSLLVSDSYVIAETKNIYDKNSEVAITIYEVKNGRIKSVRFIRDDIVSDHLKKERAEQ
jgi:hypothetical protein